MGFLRYWFCQKHYACKAFKYTKEIMHKLIKQNKQQLSYKIL